MVKFFEVRDKGKNVSVVCMDTWSNSRIDQELRSSGVEVSIGDLSDSERAILQHAGLGMQIGVILYIHLHSFITEYDHYKWQDRTHATAHKYILENWEDLKSGEVIDVEFILKESKIKKKSQNKLYFTDPDFMGVIGIDRPEKS
jgi:hypothetical protein